MANNYAAAIPLIFAQAFMALRENAVTPRLVNSNFGPEVAQKGDTITINIPSALTVTDVVPGASPVSPQDSAPTTASIPLNYWKRVAIYLTDKEVAEIVANRGVRNAQISEAIKALCNFVDRTVLGTYVKAYGFHGSPGTTPFTTANDVSDATHLRKILNKQLAPMSDRRVVLDPDAEANALEQRAFQDASWRGDAEGIINGALGRKFGMDWYMNQNVLTHTAGTITTGLAAKSATVQSAGDKTIICTTAASTGACALKKGDIVTFAGDTQTYVLTDDATQSSPATDVTLNIEPGLKKALAGGEAVSVKSSHVVNLGFHRDAIGLAIRPLAAPDGFTGGNIILSEQDPITGIPLRLEVSRQNKQNCFDFDILFGCEMVRPEFAARLAG